MARGWPTVSASLTKRTLGGPGGEALPDKTERQAGQPAGMHSNATFEPD
jgi:hypothetical protein